MTGEHRPIPPEQSLLISGICVVLFVVALCALIFFNVGCASSQTGRLLNVGIGVAASADFLSTRRAIENGSGHEMNPIVGNSAWRQAVVKGIGVGSLLGLTQVIEKQKPILSQMLRASAIAAWSAIAYHNFQVAHVRHGGR